MSSLLDLNLAAEQLLAACETALTLTTNLVGPGLGGVPVRTYVAHGPPALDCEQLTVHVLQISEETTSPLSPAPVTGQRVTRAGVIVVGFVATFVRCVPTANKAGTPPSADKLAESAAVLNADAWAVWNETSRAINAQELFGGCGGVHRDGGVPIPPSGGFGGWAFAWRVPVAGLPRS